MEFNLEEMTEEQLEQLLDAVQAKLEEMQTGEKEEDEDPEKAELKAKLSDSIDELSQLVKDVLSRKATIKANAEKRAALVDQIKAGKTGTKIRGFEEEEQKMDKFEQIATPEYRSAWLKKLQGRELTETESRAYATTDTHTAIPTLVADKMFEKLKKVAPMLNEITLMRVAGNIKFVAEGTRNAAVKHTENSVESAAADTIVSVTLGAFEFVKIIQISKAALNQSVDAFEDWLVDLLAGDIGRAIDNYIINDSSNGIAAVTYTTGTNQILQTATTGYTYANICELIALLPAGYDSEAKFLTSKATLYGKIAQICDSAKRPIFVQNVEQGMAGYLMGYPVVVDDYVATANGGLYLGKWTDVVGNLSEGIDVERDDHAAFAAAAVMFRGYAAFDSKPAKTDAIVRLVTTA